MYGWDSHDDVVENFDFEKLARSNEVASDLDVRFGRRGGRRSDGYVHRRFMCIKKGGTLAQSESAQRPHQNLASRLNIIFHILMGEFGSGPDRRFSAARNARLIETETREFSRAQMRWTSDGRRASRAVFPQSTST